MRRGGRGPLERRCACQAALRWETCENPNGQGLLALCLNPGCGIITTAPVEGSEPDDGLARFLLGDDSAPRYLAPWTRFWSRAIALGFRWKPAQPTCGPCGSELAMELRLAPRSGHYHDPHRVLLCLACGATLVAGRIDGQSRTLALEGRAWDEPVLVLRTLKRAIEELALEGQTWDFFS